MYEIHVTAVFPAPIEVVFDRLADHPRFIRGEGIDYCRVKVPGRDEPNGLGAIREVRALGLLFSEEITRFERPHGYDYRITEFRTASGRKLPFHHERGWLTLAAETGHTRVDWRSRFRIPIPLVGWVMERIQGIRLARGFAKLLAQADADIQAATPAG